MQGRKDGALGVEEGGQVCPGLEVLHSSLCAVRAPLPTLSTKAAAALAGLVAVSQARKACPGGASILVGRTGD